MPYKKRQKIVDEKSVPRNSHLGFYPLNDSDDSLLIAICATLFEEKVKEKFGNLLNKDEKVDLYILGNGRRTFYFPRKV